MDGVVPGGQDKQAQGKVGKLKDVLREAEIVQGCWGKLGYLDFTFYKPSERDGKKKKTYSMKSGFYNKC